jgi:hypothetical protein
MDILRAIGNTLVVQLRKIVPPGGKPLIVLQSIFTGKTAGTPIYEQLP